MKCHARAPRGGRFVTGKREVSIDSEVYDRVRFEAIGGKKLLQAMEYPFIQGTAGSGRCGDEGTPVSGRLVCLIGSCVNEGRVNCWLRLSAGMAVGGVLNLTCRVERGGASFSESG